MLSQAALGGMAGASATSSTNASSTQAQNSSSSTTTSQNSSTFGSSSTVENKSADYLDPASRKALEALIKQLSSGSGPTKQLSDIRLKEIAANQSARAGYTKDQAFADASAAMAGQLAKALEQAMPTLTAGIDAAGTSGSAMQALLTQQAAENAAREAATLGLNAAISYGQIQTGFGDILERLTAQGDPVTNQLIQALNIAKGSYEQSSASSKTNTSQISRGSSTQNTTGTSITTTKGSETTSQTSAPKNATAAKSGTSSIFPGLSTPGYSSTK